MTWFRDIINKLYDYWVLGFSTVVDEAWKSLFIVVEDLLRVMGLGSIKLDGLKNRKQFTTSLFLYVFSFAGIKGIYRIYSLTSGKN